MIWEYEITNITEQQSMSNELLNGRPKKLTLSTYSRLILFLLLAILIIAFPNLTDSLLLLLINIITTGMILILLLLFVQKLHWPLKSKASANPVLGFCKITVKGGWLVKETTYTNGTVHQFFKSLQELIHMIGVDNGILLEFPGQQYCFIHACAFSKISLQESLAFLKEEQALCTDAPKTDISLLPPFMNSPIVEGIPLASASFTLSKEQVKASFSEGYSALHRHLSYWKSLWKYYLYFVLLFALAFLFRSWSLAAFGIILFIAVAIYLIYAPSYKLRKDKSLQPLSLFCGSYQIELCMEGIRLAAPDYVTYLPYGQIYDVYTLNSCLCLMQTPYSFRVIPNTAFSSKEEEALFCHTLENKLCAARQQKISK